MNWIQSKTTFKYSESILKITCLLINRWKSIISASDNKKSSLNEKLKRACHWLYITRKLAVGTKFQRVFLLSIFVLFIGTNILFTYITHIYKVSECMQHMLYIYIYIFGHNKTRIEIEYINELNFIWRQSECVGVFTFLDPTIR